MLSRRATTLDVLIRQVIQKRQHTSAISSMKSTTTQTRLHMLTVSALHTQYLRTTSMMYSTHTQATTRTNMSLCSISGRFLEMASSIHSSQASQSLLLSGQQTTRPTSSQRTLRLLTSLVQSSRQSRARRHFGMRLLPMVLL